MKLYKYYSMSGQNLIALINRQFWASKPRSFNDPYDTPVKWMKVQSAIALQGERVDGRLITRKLALNQPTRAFTDEEVSKIENMGIICFSSKSDEMLLWSHYADQHKGYALEFDIPDEIMRPMNKCLVEVSYEPADYVQIFNCFADVPRYKHKAWSYENEYRYLVDEGDRLYDWANLKNGWFNSLTGIIFGNRAAENSIKAVTKIVRDINLNVRLMNARLSDKEFKLRIESLED